MTIETVQDINKGNPCTQIISASGELVNNYTGYARAGHKLDKSLSTTEIAKRIRQDIKQCGFTPKNGFKISVTSKYFAGGSAIDVRIKKMPFEQYTPEYLEVYQQYQQKWGDPDLKCQLHWLERDNKDYTPGAKVLYDTIEHIHKSYNYDDSDGMIDYFDTNYYGSVNFDLD